MHKESIIDYLLDVELSYVQAHLFQTTEAVCEALTTHLIH